MPTYFDVTLESLIMSKYIHALHVEKPSLLYPWLQRDLVWKGTMDIIHWTVWHGPLEWTPHQKQVIFHKIQRRPSPEGSKIQAWYFRQACIRRVWASGMELLAKGTLCDEIEAFKPNIKTHLFVKFVNESTLSIWFCRIIVKSPRMFVALFKPNLNPPHKQDETLIYI